MNGTPNKNKERERERQRTRRMAEEHKADRRCVSCCVESDTLNACQCPVCNHVFHACPACRGAQCPCQSAFVSRYEVNDCTWRWCRTITCSGAHVVARLTQCERCALWHCRLHTTTLGAPCRLCDRYFRWCIKDCPDTQTLSHLVCRTCAQGFAGGMMELLACAMKTNADAARLLETVEAISRKRQRDAEKDDT